MVNLRRAAAESLLQIFIVVGVALFASLILSMMIGCAATGIYQMSDEWCAKHPQAGLSRCAQNPAHNDTVPTQAYSPSAQCDEPGAGVHPYEVQGLFLLCW